MKKILVVDDEENIRMFYKEELEDEGLEVHLAGSGEEALEMIGKNSFDLVSLDIRLPGIDGIETMRRIKENWTDIPVILCSAYHHYKQEFGSWASEAYVVKSSDLKELKDTINKVLNPV
ncbi:MAG: response regulator [Thermodesulfobacteriota bacterium]